MNGLDSESRALVAHTLQRFVAEHYDPAQRLASLHATPINYHAHAALLAELGLFGLLVDGERGGLGGGVADLAQVLQVLAPGLVLEPLAEALVGTALLADAFPADTTTIEAATAGSHFALAIQPASVQAETTETGLCLHGHLSAVPYAPQAHEWLVRATLASGDTALVRVVPEAPGVRMDAYQLMDSRPAADLQFDGVDVAGTATAIAPTPVPAEVLARSTDLALTAAAADAVGIMDHLLNLTRDYLRTRIQFGVALGSFQALQHRLADLHMAYLEARGLLRAWTEALDEGAPPARLNPLRRALVRVVPRSGIHIGQQAIQLHGGMGLTEELVVSHCNARLQVIATALHAWVHLGVHEDFREAA